MDVASRASDPPADPVVVEITSDGNYSPEAFRAFVERHLAAPEPELETIGAVEALRDLRADA
jgi:hypothetical protein